jgi:signal transduction histidine kinase
MDSRMRSLKPVPNEKDVLIEELRAQIRARDQFLAIAAHELRNPLTPVVMCLHSTLRMARALPGLPEMMRTRLQQAIDAMDHYIRRLDVLLDVSRINSGNLRLAPVEIDLAEVARGAGASLMPLAEHAGSILEIDAHPVVGWWDRIAVEQILQNLISNAIKYGQGRPVTVTVRRDGDAAVVAVRDQGIGIARDDQPRIFQAFERAALSGGHSGFGVGLWVTHRLVEAMGGSVRVDSAPGAGATFTVALPRGTAKRED